MKCRNIKQFLSSKQTSVKCNILVNVWKTLQQLLISFSKMLRCFMFCKLSVVILRFPHTDTFNIN